MFYVCREQFHCLFVIVSIIFRILRTTDKRCAAGTAFQRISRKLKCLYAFHLTPVGVFAELVFRCGFYVINNILSEFVDKSV